jgi:hypothetical protein
LIELKYTDTYVVNLSPHQVSFHAAHQRASSWVLVKAAGRNGGAYELILYHAAKSAEVKKRGLLAAPDLTLLKPKSYEEVFLMIEKGRPEC